MRSNVACSLKLQPSSGYRIIQKTGICKEQFDLGDSRGITLGRYHAKRFNESIIFIRRLLVSYLALRLCCVIDRTMQGTVSELFGLEIFLRIEVTRSLESSAMTQRTVAKTSRLLLYKSTRLSKYAGDTDTRKSISLIQSKLLAVRFQK